MPTSPIERGKFGKQSGRAGAAADGPIELVSLSSGDEVTFKRFAPPQTLSSPPQPPLIQTDLARAEKYVSRGGQKKKEQKEKETGDGTEGLAAHRDRDDI